MERRFFHEGKIDRSITARELYGMLAHDFDDFRNGTRLCDQCGHLTDYGYFTDEGFFCDDHDDIPDDAHLDYVNDHVEMRDDLDGLVDLMWFSDIDWRSDEGVSEAILDEVDWLYNLDFDVEVPTKEQMEQAYDWYLGHVPQGYEGNIHDFRTLYIGTFSDPREFGKALMQNSLDNGDSTYTELHDIDPTEVAVNGYDEGCYLCSEEGFGHCFYAD